MKILIVVLLFQDSDIKCFLAILYSLPYNVEQMLKSEKTLRPASKDLSAILKSSI